MRIVHISDTHGIYPKSMPDGDILVHSGDITLHGDVNEYAEFSGWINHLKYRRVVITPGNHDRAVAENRPAVEALLPPKAKILVNDGLTVSGIRFYGMPYTPIFGRWSFMAHRKEMANYCEMIPECDVLITHGPAAGVLDGVHYYEGTEHAGCPELSQAISRVQPRLHLFGHIHESYGFRQVGATRYYNSAIAGDNLQETNKPAVIDL